MPALRMPVETPLGRLSGRNCIYLDRCSADENAQELALEGDISGLLVDSTLKETWVPYVIRFRGVAA